MNHPRIEKKYINKKISGAENKNWLDYFKLKYVPETFTTAASLGCGGGGLERHAHHLGISQDFDGFDIAMVPFKSPSKKQATWVLARV